MSYKPEFLIEGTWACNALAFATMKEAELYALDLFQRWIVPEAARAVGSEQPVNYRRHEDGRIEAVT